MRDVDKHAGVPQLDSIVEQWRDLGAADTRVEALSKILESVLVQKENENLRDEVTAVVQGVPSLFELMNSDARGDRSITLLDHSIDVLQQNMDYQTYRHLPADGVTPLAFAKFLLGHDSGKSLPADKTQAGPYTIDTIKAHNDLFTFSERELAVVTALLSHDPIGRVMHCGVCPFDKETEARFAVLRNKTNGDIPLEEREKIDPRYILKAKHKAGTLLLEDIQHYSTTARVTDDTEALNIAIAKSVAEVQSAAEMADMPPASYFQLLSVFYQLDVSAYSIDVGLKREVGLEFLMEINPDFSIAEPTEQKLFLPDQGQPLPLQFSRAAATCHNLLKQQLGI